MWGEIETVYKFFIKCLLSTCIVWSRGWDIFSTPQLRVIHLNSWSARQEQVTDSLGLVREGRKWYWFMCTVREQILELWQWEILISENVVKGGCWKQRKSKHDKHYLYYLQRVTAYSNFSVFHESLFIHESWFKISLWDNMG